jgi:hypothetical protein
MLICDRTEPRFLESLSQAFVKPIQMISPSLYTTPVLILAKAMIAATIFGVKKHEKSGIIHNANIFKLAEYFDEQSFPTRY